MDQERLDEIRARCETATRGPWAMADPQSLSFPYYSTVPRDADSRYVCQSFTTRTDVARVNNGVFIAHSRQDVPDLLEHIEEQGAKIERLLVALRLAESLCHDSISLSVDLGGKVRGVHQCKVCFAKFRSWESGDKHAPDCAFAMLED